MMKNVFLENLPRDSIKRCVALEEILVERRPLYDAQFLRVEVVREHSTQKMKIPTAPRGGVSLQIVGIFKVANTLRKKTIEVYPTVASDGVFATNNPLSRGEGVSLTRSKGARTHLMLIKEQPLLME